LANALPASVQFEQLDPVAPINPPGLFFINRPAAYPAPSKIRSFLFIA
jgi:hypothetical protein